MGLPLFAPNNALNNFLRVKDTLTQERLAIKTKGIIDDVEIPVASTSKSPAGGRRRWVVIAAGSSEDDKKLDDSRSEDSE